MKKHTVSIPVKVADFFEDLENAECGMAYRLLINYITTGKMPALAGKPSAVKLAMKYAVEKMQRSVARRFPPREASEETHTDEANLTQTADLRQESGHKESPALGGESQSVEAAKEADGAGPAVDNKASGDDCDAGDKKTSKEVPQEHINTMQKVVKLAVKVCSTRKLRRDKIVSQLHERFPGLYRDIIYNDYGDVVLIPA